MPHDWILDDWDLGTRLTYKCIRCQQTATVDTRVLPQGASQQIFIEEIRDQQTKECPQGATHGNQTSQATGSDR